MANGKRFYWVKLYEGLIDDFDNILSLPGGSETVVIYIKLCSITLHTNGKLQRRIENTDIELTADILQRVYIKHFTAEIIQKALDTLEEEGLLYRDIDGVLNVSNYKDIAGSKTDYAIEKQMYRAKQKRFYGPKEEAVDESLELIADLELLEADL